MTPRTTAATLVAPSGEGALETAMRAIKRMRPPPDARMLMTRWAAWAANHAKTDRLVTRLRKRWYRGRAARWLRAWSRMSSPRDGRGVAAQGSARQLARRTQRRAFVTWRGICAGLAAHELALLDAGTSMLAAGSPAAGLAAIAALAKSDPSAAGDGRTRRAAVAAAIAEAGAAEDFGRGRDLGRRERRKKRVRDPGGVRLRHAASIPHDVGCGGEAEGRGGEGGGGSGGRAGRRPRAAARLHRRRLRRPVPCLPGTSSSPTRRRRSQGPRRRRFLPPAPLRSLPRGLSRGPWPRPSPGTSRAGRRRDAEDGVRKDRTSRRAAVAALFGRRARGKRETFSPRGASPRRARGGAPERGDGRHQVRAGGGGGGGDGGGGDAGDGKSRGGFCRRPFLRPRRRRPLGRDRPRGR